MNRIDELKDLIADNRKRCAELEDRLHEIRESLFAEEDKTVELKRALLKTLLEEEYESGYAVYSVTYTYAYNDTTWTRYDTKIFDISTPEGTIERYFYREVNSYLKWNDLWGKAIYKLNYAEVSINQLSKYDIDELLEELEPY